MPNDSALCATHIRKVGDLWFSDNPKDQDAAKQICYRCPVIADCRTEALALGIEAHGIWGGWTDGKRRGIRMQQNRPPKAPRPPAAPPACGTEAALLRHSTRHEQCDTCTTAHTQRVTAGRRELLKKHHEAGGTSAGAILHRRLGEPPCDPCITAERAKTAQARAKREREAALVALPDVA